MLSQNEREDRAKRAQEVAQFARKDFSVLTSARKVKLSIADLIDATVKALIESDEVFQSLIKAIRDEDTVTGKLDYDDYRASDYLINYLAKSNEAAVIKDVLPIRLVRAIRVVKKRYGVGRKQLEIAAKEEMRRIAAE